MENPDKPKVIFGKVDSNGVLKISRGWAAILVSLFVVIIATMFGAAIQIQTNSSNVSNIIGRVDRLEERNAETFGLLRGDIRRIGDKLDQLLLSE